MSTNTSRKRRNENNDRVDDGDDEYIENGDNHMNIGSDGNDRANVNDDNDQSGFENNQHNDDDNVKNTNDDDEEEKGTSYRIDEEYDIHNDKKRKSNNDVMINYAEIFTELVVQQKESSTIIMELLKQHPIAAQQINNNGNYPLHVACRHLDHNNDTILLKLIDLYKIAVTKPNNDGHYPLHIACYSVQSEDVILKLIEVFPDAASILMDRYGGNLPLHLACERIKSETVIRKLIEINPKALQQKDGDNRYPIHYAIDGNQSSEIVQHILDDSMISYANIFEDGDSPFDIHGFMEKYPTFVQQIDRNGDYLLHVACRDPNYGNNDHEFNVIMSLIELCALAATKPDKDGFYPLHIACRYGQPDNVIARLIETFPEAASNSLNQTGSYPLNLACRYVRSDTVIRTLVELNPTALQQKDNDGNYPIHSAIIGKQSNNIMQLILNVDPLSIQRQDGRAASPLHHNYRNRLNLILMESMVPYSNILINMRDNLGMTPLHLACQRGKDDVVERLLQYPGIDINAKTNIDKTTPLHIASFRPRVNIVKKLLDHLCIVFNEKDSENKTPLDLTKQGKKKLEDTDDRQNERIINFKNRKISEFLQIKKLLEDFPVTRRWHAFVYHFKNCDDEQSVVLDNHH